MRNKVDICLSATRFILEYGDDAAIIAAMEADSCAQAGDLDGKVAWLKVTEAIKVYRDEGVSSGTPTIH